MNAQPIHLVVDNTHQPDPAREVELLQDLYAHLAVCEEMVLNLPLRRYEVLNDLVPGTNIRNQITKLKQRFEDGINTVMNAEVA